MTTGDTYGMGLDLPLVPFPQPTPLDRARSCLIGGAVGDALGAPIEFLSLVEIRSCFGATHTSCVIHR